MGETQPSKPTADRPRFDDSDITSLDGAILQMCRLRMETRPLRGVEAELLLARVRYTLRDASR